MKTILAIAAALLAAQPLSAQQSIEAPGPVAHAAAGTSFAERVGAFRRINVTRFDSGGRDISANYDLVRADGRVRASLFIYPVAPDGAPPPPGATRADICDGEYSSLKQAIERQYKGAALIEESLAPPVAGVQPRYTHRSIHRFRGDIGAGVEDLRSESRLYCFVGGGWLVKYRISSSAGMDASAEIETFIRTSAWPGRARPQDVVSGPGKGAVAR